MIPRIVRINHEFRSHSSSTTYHEPDHILAAGLPFATNDPSSFSSPTSSSASLPLSACLTPQNSPRS
eukprot:768133-Hanusia_phi.AAC.5